MKKKYFIILALLLISSFSFGQTYNMPITGTFAYTTCGGNFYDSGGAAANYSLSETGVITFTPSTAGDLMKISFTAFNTEPNGTGCYDYLEVWNGIGTAGAPASTYCGVLPAFTITSTNTTNGSLTFRFTSDASTNRAGWTATLSCVTPCIAPVAALVDTSTVTICPPTSLSPGSLTVAFDGSSSTATQGAVAKYEWEWGDGTTSSTLVPTTTHTYPGTGGIYKMKLAVRNNNIDIDPLGCRSTNSVTRLIRVLPPPNFTGTTTGPIASDCPNSVTLTGVAASQNYTATLPPAVSVTTALPDGTGSSYTSGIDYTGYFTAGSTMTAGCYPTVTFNIEHSYAPDLSIDLIAPSGETVRLFNREGNVTVPSGWPLGTLPYVNHFGSCSNNADNGLPGCGANYTVVSSGGQLWSDSSQTVSQTTTATCAGFAGPCEVGKYYKPITYTSSAPFTTLLGATMNGTWTIKITDYQAADDGTLFGWSLSFPTACMSVRETVNPDMVSAVWSHSGTGPAVPAQSSTSVVVTDPGPDACPVAGTCLGNRLTNAISVGPFTDGGAYVYDLLVTDEFGCQYTRSVTVNIPNGPTFTVPADITQCAGTTVPVANFTSTPAGATFTWTNSNTGIGLAASGSGNVPAFTATNGTGSPITATITVTATPATGCPTTKSYTITVDYTPVAPTASVTFQPTCTTPTGTIVVTAPTGGTLEYNINGGTYQASTTFSGLAPGTYNVTVKDIGVGCVSAVTTLTVNPITANPAAPTASVTFQPTCTTPTGTIVVTAPTGGTLEYNVNGGTYQVSTTFSGLAPGTYDVRVKDTGTGCVSAVTTLTVNPITANPAAPTASVTFQPTCTTPTGTIVVTAPTGGTLEYNVNGGTYQASTTFSGLAPGTYDVRVKDNGTGCVSAVTTLTVNPITANPAAPTASVTVQPICTTPTGTIEVTAPTGGTLEYNVNGGTYQASTTFSGLAPGTYDVRVKDTGTGCVSAVTTLTVNPIPANPAAPTASVTVQPTCTTPTGTIEVTAPIGGTLEYNVNGGTYQASTTFSGLAPGTYDVRVKDTGTGCVSAVTTLTVNPIPANPAAPTASVTVQPTCTTPTGTIEVTAPTGGTLEYNVNGGTYQASTTFSGLAPGTYDVRVKDTVTGCVSVVTTLTVNPIPANPLAPTASVTFQPTCTTPTGTIEVTAPTGGTLEYNVNGGTYQASTTFSGLAPGTYDVTVKDTGTGCVSAVTTLTVNPIPANPLAPTASVTVQPTCTTPTGTIEVTAPTGGTLEYNVNGGTYQASTTFSGLAPGTYDVTVKDTGTGCISAVTTLTVNPIPANPVAPTASVTVQPTCTSPTGTIEVTAPTGGTLEYSTGGAYQVSTTFSGLTPATYNVTVKDTGTGCISAATILTVNPAAGAPPVPTASVTVQPTCSTATGTIEITAPTGGTLEYSIGGAYQVSTIFPGLIPGTYTVSVRDTGTGCISATTLTVNPQPATPITPTVSTTAPTCSSDGVSTVSNYDGTLTYIFTPSGPTVGAGGVISGMTIGTSYTVVASNGSCSSASSTSFSNGAMLITPAVPTVNTTAPTCSAAGSSTITNYDGTLTYIFTPAGPTVGAGGAISGMTIGTSYTVVASNGSCSSASSTSFSNGAMLITPAVPTVNTTAPTCSAAGSSTITNYDGTLTYIFTPSGPTVGAGGAISGMTVGTSYTVVASNGSCSSASSASFSNGAMLITPAVPAVNTTAPTCSAAGSSTITNYDGTLTYIFTPAGPTVGAGGAISGMTVGTSYTVVASNGSCSSASSTSFSNGAMLITPAVPTVNTTAPTCSAAGSSTITNYDGTLTYIFTPAGPTVGAGGAISGMTIGTSYTVVASNGSCSSASSTSFSNGALITPAVPTVNTTAPTCSTAGSSTITNYDGTLTYIFTPAGPTVGAGGAISGMTVGTSYTVVASNGSCSSASSTPFSNGVMLITPAVPTVNTTAPTCSAAGSSTITNYDGTLTYIFTPSGPTVGAGGAISGMTVGTSYTVVASNGSCSSASSASFSNGAMLITPAVPTVNTTAPTCSAAGSSTITNYDGTLTYTFTPSGPTVGAGGAISGMTVGTSYTVVASNGSCSSASSTSFSNGAMLITPAVPTVNTTMPTCSSDGVSTVTNYDGTLTYIFAPSGPTVGAGGAISAMTVGTSYTVVASNGSCSSASSASFSNGAMLITPAVPTVNTTAPTCSAAGSSTITNYDGTLTYIFTPSGPTVGAGGTINGMTVGTSYTVVASNGSCSSASSSSFSNGAMYIAPSAPTASVTTQPTCALSTGTIVITAPIGGTLQYSTGGAYQGSAIFSGLAPGTYNVTVKDTGTGCVSAATTLTVNPMPICDSDGDGVLDATEIADGTNPLDQCSLVIASQTLPPSTTWNNADCDADGVNNATEIADGTNLLDPCSLIVASQTLPIGTATWNNLDCDNDGVFNGYETGTMPWSTSDTDSDGILDYLDPDDDNDGIITVNENPDPNNDGNPNDAFDSDGDSIPDYLEPNSITDSEDNLEVFAMVTPNGDGDNDVLVISNVEKYPDNTLEIFNRWGVKVYEVQGYGQDGKYFKGVSEGRVTINQASELPVGTYFYMFEYRNSGGVTKNRSGYLYINR